jgi:acyl carrier protein
MVLESIIHSQAYKLMINTKDNIFQSLITLSGEQRKLFELLLNKQGEDLLRIKIPQRNSSDIIPLSYSQERVWSVARLTSDSPVDNVPLGFRILGDFNLQVFEQSVNALIQRNEILRTTCITSNHKTTQTVMSVFTPWIEVINLCKLPKAERLENAIKKATEISRLPFDLAQDVLFRTAIFCLGEKDFVVLLVAHQFATDGLSFRFLLQDLAALYKAIQADNLSTLPDQPIQYADFSAWQRQWFTNEMFASQIQYWKQQLSGAPSQLRLPIYQSCSFPTYEGAYKSFELSAQHSSKLRAVCGEQGVTVFMAFLALFQTVLHRCTLEKDICIGTLISNRNRPEIEQLLGNFSNNLLLRTTFSKGLTFKDVLAKVRETTIEAYNHQDLPFQNLARIAESIPKFQVLLILRNSTTAQNLVLPDLEVSDISIDLGLTRMELGLDLTDDGKNPIFGKLEYKTELFKPDTIEKLIRNLQVLLESIIENPNQEISGIHLPEKISIDEFVYHLPENIYTENILKETNDQQFNQVSSPQTEVEEIIASIWTEIFNIPKISINDNFFDLGGHSLMAIRIIERIQDSFQIDLPFNLIFKSPSIAKLAEQVEIKLQTSINNANELFEENLLQEEDFSHVITIQSQGEHPPLFWINNLPQAQMLGSRWGVDRPIYCLDIFGLKDDYVLNSKVDLKFIASQFVESIISLQPAGPYYLGAHCVNTTLAFEIAQQLYHRGETVASLMFVDPLTFGFMIKSKSYHHWINFRRLGFDYLFFKYGLNLKTGLLKKGSKAYPLMNYLVDKFLLRRAVSEVELSDEINEYISGYYKAVSNYVPEKYPGKISLFLAAEYASLDTSIFERLALGGVEVQEVREYHVLLFFEESHTNDLAKALKNCLIEGEQDFNSNSLASSGKRSILK